MKRKINTGTYSYKTHQGRVRLLNEDAVKVLVNSDGDVLLIAADGMGGHKKGEFASSELVLTFERSFKEKKSFSSLISAKQWIRASIKKANNSIYKTQQRSQDYSGMATTATVVLIRKNKMVIANCGDSRAYILKDDELIKMTEDQTYVNYLVHCGEITESEALTRDDRHVLTNAVGLYASVSFDLQTYKYEGEKVLVCTDGLYNFVKFEDIQNVLRTDNSTEEKCLSLVNLANFNGGDDNITVAIWEPSND